MGEQVVLVGMMGSGKTTVGRRLARRLHRPFVDSDEQVEARTGRTVADIFRTDGEAAFRPLEAEALAAALAADPPAVVAAAGGTVLDPDNRRAMAAAGTVVWLRADPAVLAARVAAAGDDHRPLLDDDPAGTLRRLADERDVHYHEVADLVVDVDELDPDAIVAQIVRRLPAGVLPAGAADGGAS